MYKDAIMCSTYPELTELIPLITQSYNSGIYVHFINNIHQGVNCYAIENTQIIYIPSSLRQAARIVINLYNEHFGMNENDDDDDDNNDDNDDDNSESNDEHEENNENNESDEENEQHEESFIDENIAFTCPACHIQTL